MWGWFGRERHSHEVPHDNPDLAFTMAAVCGVGALSAWRTRGSQMGLLSGVVVSGVFGLGGTWLMGVEPEKHELAHQLCLLASVLFSGAMGYRAGSNVYSGPGGTMLAALGGVSALYHGTKFTEWRNYELGRVQEAERLLREWEVRSRSANVESAQPGMERGRQAFPGPRPLFQHGDEPGRAPPPPLPMWGFGSRNTAGGEEGAWRRRGRPNLERRMPVPPGGF